MGVGFKGIKNQELGIKNRWHITLIIKELQINTNSFLILHS